MRNSCHKRFTSASFLHSLLLSNLPRSSVKSDLCQISAHFYSKHHRQNGYDRQHLNTQWLYRLHEALTKCGRLFTEIRLVKVRHNTKQACLQGGLWNQYTDPIEDENLVKFMYEIYTQYKNSKLKHGQNTRTKIIQKRYQMHNYTHRRSDRPIQSLQSHAHRFVG